MESYKILESKLAQTTGHPLELEIERAEGSYIYDRNGKKYLDMISGIGVSILGHKIPEINKALKEQIDLHLHVMVYGEFIQSPQKKLASELSKYLPDSLDSYYFLNSGTEANEAALKLAKRVTGRSKIVSFHGAYHGSTHGSLSISSNEKKKYAFRPLLPETYFIELNDLEGLKKLDETVACVFLETVQGDAGVRIPSHQFMLELRNKCSEKGICLILDEIQCGLGRTGKFNAFEHFDIVPDILTLGKALGGGLPFGCMASSKEFMKTLTQDPELGHITTFGGHPLPCVASYELLKLLQLNNLIEQVQEKEEVILKGLENVNGIKEIRSLGLFFAVELQSAELVNKVVQKSIEKGVILFWFLSSPESFRMAPPLNIDHEDLLFAVNVIKEAIEESL